MEVTKKTCLGMKFIGTILGELQAGEIDVSLHFLRLKKIQLMPGPTRKRVQESTQCQHRLGRPTQSMLVLGHRAGREMGCRVQTCVQERETK